MFVTQKETGMQIRGQLPELSRFTYGTMSLGAGAYDMAADVKVARAAMDSGVWFHTSADYGETYKVLRRAFDEDRARVPKLIVKMDAKFPEKTHAVIEGTVRDLGVERVDIAQMCWHVDAAGIAGQARDNGPRWQAFCDLKKRGLVGNFVLEIWPPALSCENGVEAVQNDLVDGLIFYYNLFERFVSNELFDLIEKRKTKVLALRTLGGGRAQPTQDPKGQALEALFQKSGCRNMLEFGVRFVLSDPNVQTTICGTRRLEHLNALLDAARNFKPLDSAVVSEVKSLHRKWSEEK